MKAATSLLAASALFGIAAACSVVPAPPPPPRLHDLGAGPPPRLGGVTAAPEVRVEAPPWMDDQDIQYRLMYEDPTQLRSYAVNRWVARPSEMVEERLEAALGQTAGARRAPAAAPRGGEIRLVLERFEQRFLRPGQARVVVRARAELRRPDGHTASRVFELSERSAPNVDGAVRGLGQVTDALVRKVLRWASG